MKHFCTLAATFGILLASSWLGLPAHCANSYVFRPLGMTGRAVSVSGMPNGGKIPKAARIRRSLTEPRTRIHAFGPAAGALSRISLQRQSSTRAEYELAHKTWAHGCISCGAGW